MLMLRKLGAGIIAGSVILSLFNKYAVYILIAACVVWLVGKAIEIYFIGKDAGRW